MPCVCSISWKTPKNCPSETFVIQFIGFTGDCHTVGHEKRLHEMVSECMANVHRIIKGELPRLRLSVNRIRATNLRSPFHTLFNHSGRKWQQPPSPLLHWWGVLYHDWNCHIVGSTQW